MTRKDKFVKIITYFPQVKNTFLMHFLPQRIQCFASATYIKSLLPVILCRLSLV